MSGSISSSQIWLPFGKFCCLGVKAAPAIRPGSMSSGRLGGLNDLRRDLADRQRPVRARRGKEAILELDLVRLGAEQMRGDRLGLGHDLLGREIDRRPAERRRARAAGALADRNLVGVALDVMHLVGIDAEPVAQQLLVDRLVPLALGDRARQQGHGAAAVEAHLGRLEAAGGGALDRVGDAEAAQSAARPRFGAAALRTRRRRRARSAMSRFLANSPQS